MAEVKGRFITLTGTLMSPYPRQLDQANTLLMAKCGKLWNELDPDGWYDTSSWAVFMDAYAKAFCRPGPGPGERWDEIFIRRSRKPAVCRPP